MKALITFPYTEEEFAVLRDLGYEIIFKREKEIEFSEEIADVDVIVSMNVFDKVDISKLKDLKWIQLISAGINQVPKDLIIDRNIKLTNNRGCYSIPIAEWILLKTLEMLKNSKEFYRKQDSKTWEVVRGLKDLNKKTIGFVGTGSIASEAAKRFCNFGVEILGLNTDGRDVEHFHRTYAVDKINDFVSKSDIVVVTTPYTEETHHMIDRDVFKHMKDGVYLINIGRGSIIEEEALIQNLRSGKVAKAALDVFEKEPLPEDNPLWEMENVYVSPHNSASSPMNHERIFDIAYKNMKKYIRDEKLINEIDLEKGY